jgi:hypothetical protein
MKIDKIRKALPAVVLEEMDKLGETDLQKSIAQSEEAIAQATRERDANTKYNDAKQAVSDLSEGLKGVKKYQTAKIHYALQRLRELRGDSIEE